MKMRRIFNFRLSMYCEDVEKAAPALRNEIPFLGAKCPTVRVYRFLAAFEGRKS